MDCKTKQSRSYQLRRCLKSNCFATGKFTIVFIFLVTILINIGKQYQVQKFYNSRAFLQLSGFMELNLIFQENQDVVVDLMKAALKSAIENNLIFSLQKDNLPGCTLKSTSFHGPQSVFASNVISPPFVGVIVVASFRISKYLKISSFLLSYLSPTKELFLKSRKKLHTRIWQLRLAADFREEKAHLP